MSNEWLTFLFFIAAIILAMDVTRRAVIEMYRANGEKAQLAALRRLRKPIQPWVTVLIYSKNQSESLVRTVRQVCRSRYALFDVVAISDRATDDTEARIIAYQASVTHDRLRFLKRRKLGSMGDAYRAGYRKSRHGSIVICLQAGDTVDPLLLKRAVISTGTKQIWQVDLQQNDTQEGLFGIVQRIQRAVWNYSIKIQVCTSRALRHLRIKRRGLHLVGSSLVWVVALALIVTVALINTLAFWYVWLLCTVYSLALVWLSARESGVEKRRDSLAIPSALFLVPVTHFVGVISQLSTRK